MGLQVMNNYTWASVKKTDKNSSKNQAHISYTNITTWTLMLVIADDVLKIQIVISLGTTVLLPSCHVVQPCKSMHVAWQLIILHLQHEHCSATSLIPATLTSIASKSPKS